MKKTTTFFYLAFIFSFWFTKNLIAQSSTIKPTDACINCTANIPASAVMDIQSTTKDILIPRMTAAQRDVITNLTNGLIVFVTDTNSFWYYNGTIWTNMAQVIVQDNGNMLINKQLNSTNTGSNNLFIGGDAGH